MKATLLNADYLQVLNCIEAIHRCRTLSDFPGHVLHAFGKLIRYSAAAFNEVNLARNRLIAITDRPLGGLEKFARPLEHGAVQYEFPSRLANIWEKYCHQHPLVRYVGETGDGQAVKISDFLSVREYHRLDLYREFYGPLFAEDQMSITIRSDNGFLIAIAFNRARRDFTECDRVKLNLVRPHLLQAYANVEELAGHLEEKRDLQTALRETGLGLIAFNPVGEPAHATPGAFDCMARYFPDWDRDGRLPQAIDEWLRRGADEPFAVQVRTSRLIVRAPRQSERRLLLLSEESGRGLPAGVHLTSRENEVLAWLAEGKTNPEIAVILGVASGTVKMHVENILAKLGVDNRTAATMLAREAGLVSRR